jgi:2'-5' RNA ligase
MGLDDASQALTRLTARLSTDLKALGFPPEERPFRPHLTLARAQNTIRSSQLWPMLQGYQNRPFGVFVVTQLHLFQSQLQRSGAVYTILHSVTLQS